MKKLKVFETGYILFYILMILGLLMLVGGSVYLLLGGFYGIIGIVNAIIFFTLGIIYKKVNHTNEMTSEMYKYVYKKWLEDIKKDQ